VSWLGETLIQGALGTTCAGEEFEPSLATTNTWFSERFPPPDGTNLKFSTFRVLTREVGSTVKEIGI
jgi:hypothetical protein